MKLRSIVPLVALLSLLVVACGRGEVSASRWQAMSVDERTLIVRALLGAETVAARKGGTSATYSGTADDYVERIDALYQRGDDRTVEGIWPQLADRE
jgi:hypothetical protein